MHSSVEEVIADINNNKMFILLDDEERENEGDLVFPAEIVTPDHINFMIKFGRGLVCMPISQEIADRLELKLMSENNQSKYNTAFTVSVGSRSGITTGISAYDRATTIKTVANADSTPYDIVTPGHVFPVVAVKGGLIQRQGHTEASVSIAKLMNLQPCAVICEIVKDNGKMARRDDILEFAQEHNLKVTTIKCIIEYIKQKGISFDL